MLQAAGRGHVKHTDTGVTFGGGGARVGKSLTPQGIVSLATEL